MKKISLIGLILVTAFFNAAMARSGQYDEDAAPEKLKNSSLKKPAPEKRAPLKTIVRNQRKLRTTMSEMSLKTPPRGRLENARHRNAGRHPAGRRKVVDNTIRGVKKSRLLGWPKTTVTPLRGRKRFRRRR